METLPVIFISHAMFAMDFLFIQTPPLRHGSTRAELNVARNAHTGDVAGPMVSSGTLANPQYCVTTNGRGLYDAGEGHLQITG